MTKAEKRKLMEAVDERLRELRAVMRDHIAEHEAGKCEMGMCAVAGCKNNPFESSTQ